jgi:hypothetical protein
MLPQASEFVLPSTGTASHYYYIFGKQNTDIWLEAFKIHVLKQVTKHIEKLQCGGVVEQLCQE